jgi:histidine ammonia-lyase
MPAFKLGTRAKLQDLVEVAERNRKIQLPDAARARIRRARRAVLRAKASGQAIYGVNTGFGEQASVRISAAAIRQLQVNYVRSHSSGIDDPLTEVETRGLMFLRANEFARGHSGVRVEVVTLMVRMLNAGVLPFVPGRGSVGASGDLAPMAHMALAMIGEGFCLYKGRKKPAAKALSAAGLKPVVLEAKEALSLTNGTQAMQSVGGLALVRALRVLESANIAAAMGLEAIMGTPVPFDARISALKPHPGQVRTAAAMRKLLRGSEIRLAHIEDDERVQDSYSFRCVPQVHGAALDALEHAVRVVETEMASVTDNPIVDGRDLLSGGNFHGQPLAFAFDHAATVSTALGGVSERRLFQVVCAPHPGLTQFLVEEPGLESGYMIPQYAAAALASENLTLAHPASVGSLPTSANKEDFVSMGMWGAHKLKRVVENSSRIVAIELLAAAQALEKRKPLKPGKGVAEGLRRLRRRVPASKGDESLSGKIETAHRMIVEGHLGGIS